jgi:hypothetical protein
MALDETIQWANMFREVMMTQDRALAHSDYRGGEGSSRGPKGAGGVGGKPRQCGISEASACHWQTMTSTPNEGKVQGLHQVEILWDKDWVMEVIVHLYESDVG